MVSHPIEPVYDADSRVLILGSFPSVKSREAAFYYGHPQNRFWKVLASVFQCAVPISVEEKREFLLLNRIALWDVIASCDIYGSSDASIRNVIPNAVERILDTALIEEIYVNGKTAEKYYKKYLEKTLGKKAICLPSTSPANAGWSLERLVEAWSVIQRT